MFVLESKDIAASVSYGELEGTGVSDMKTPWGKHWANTDVPSTKCIFQQIVVVASCYTSKAVISAQVSYVKQMNAYDVIFDYFRIFDKPLCRQGCEDWAVSQVHLMPYYLSRTLQGDITSELFQFLGKSFNKESATYVCTWNSVNGLFSESSMAGSDSWGRRVKQRQRAGYT
jgi:hypothetical protein